MKSLDKMEDMDGMDGEVPFGPPPEYYNYRCSNCQNECEVNEVIIDVEMESPEDSMPVLTCPNCSRRTLKYVKDG